MRRLNVALVDIGAGTSDIAITNNDTIVNYGMVPVAGDEITEAISDQFLLDFPDAEKAKLELTNSDSITVKDILGFENIVQKDEVIAAISTAIDRLATLIADEIMRLNGLKPPQAVMLIGGGSLTPEIPKKISEKLNLPVNRVAIRGIDAVGQVLFAEEVTNQPELITPVGIAVSAHQHSIQYKNVFVNDRPLRLLELNDLTVGDCLVQSGIRMSQLYGKPGLAKIITVNDQLLTLKGQMGSSPILKKNGVPCTLDDPVCEGDRIIAIKGTDGKEAVHTIKDIIGEQSIPFILNQKPYTYRPNIFVNGQLTNFDYMIQDKDQIHIEECTIANAIRSISDQTVNIEPFKVWINDQEVHLPDYSGKILKNGRNTHLHDIIQPNDQIEVKFTEQPTVEQLATQQNWQLTIEIPVFFNGKEVRVSKTITKVIRNEKELTKHDEIFNGDRLFIKKMTNIQFVFQDVFRFVDFHFPKNAIQYKILLNGQNAALHTPIHAGDQLEIIWVEEGL